MSTSTANPNKSGRTGPAKPEPCAASSPGDGQGRAAAGPAPGNRTAAAAPDPGDGGEKRPIRPLLRPSLLERLGVFGMDSIEPVVLASLVTAEPLLLIGPHGTGKSYLLARIAAALGLAWRHYNASLLNYDDLVGYPLPDGKGSLEYIRTPASIWGAGAVFIDEISRCRPDIQNKLFPIIHERRVQGMLLEDLVYRWSAMNPPGAGDDDDDPAGPAYIGSEPLDPALADRFAFVVEMPDWRGFGEADKERVIRCDGNPVPPDAAAVLRARVERGRALLPGIRRTLGDRIAVYARIAAALLVRAGVELSPRRCGMIYRNVLAVHAVRLSDRLDGAAEDSAGIALAASIPDAASGRPVDRVKVLAAHKEAWAACGPGRDEPVRLLALENDPLNRFILATRCASLSPAEYSTIVADAINSLPPGGRHAVAMEAVESEAAGRLVAAVAEECGRLYALAATPQSVNTFVRNGSSVHNAWKAVEGILARLDRKLPDSVLVANLLVGLWSADEFETPEDVERVYRSWREARAAIERELP